MLALHLAHLLKMAEYAGHIGLAAAAPDPAPAALGDQLNGHTAGTDDLPARKIQLSGFYAAFVCFAGRDPAHTAQMTVTVEDLTPLWGRHDSI
ncbi:hypothetical protein ACGFYU_25480 [Streptomyces sp. NPDC048337]|uniref:hypothetical protein n=1 Tax=Streptomyces sp. NPDC048337 TaxID=3365535 RepID=UPI0037139184